MPATDAAFVTRVFLGAVFCASACLVVSAAVLWWAGRLAVAVRRLESRVDDLEGDR